MNNFFDPLGPINRRLKQIEEQREKIAKELTLSLRIYASISSQATEELCAAYQNALAQNASAFTEAFSALQQSCMIYHISIAEELQASLLSLSEALRTSINEDLLQIHIPAEVDDLLQEEISKPDFQVDPDEIVKVCKKKDKLSFADRINIVIAIVSLLIGLTPNKNEERLIAQNETIIQQNQEIIDALNDISENSDKRVELLDAVNQAINALNENVSILSDEIQTSRQLQDTVAQDDAAEQTED